LTERPPPDLPHQTHLLITRPKKMTPNRSRWQPYQLPCGIRTVDITTSKLHWNSILSTQQAKYMCLDLKNFYLSATLDRYKYMRIPISLLPSWIVAHYNLLHKVVKGHIYLKMQRAVWCLPQAGILANKFLHKRLAPHRYSECKQMPGLWKLLLTLVVDSFGMKYVNNNDVNHLIKCLKHKYKITKDWDGNLYCGIKL
jgi:hypothetical protein